MADVKCGLNTNSIQIMIDKALHRGDTYSATILRKVQKDIEKTISIDSGRSL